MALPKSVQEAADRAEEIERQMNGNPEEAPQETATQAADAAPVETAAAESQSQEPTEPQKAEGDKWEAKYKTLQGMYNADVPRMKKQNEQLEAQLAQYAEQVKQLRESIAQHEEEKKYITDEDSEVFGADVVDLAQRAAKEEASRYSREAATMRNEVEELKAELGRVRDVSFQNTQQQYLTRLTELVPDWEKQNTDQGFLDWLNERDPFAGGVRKQALDEAYGSLDARRTADIFLAYRQATGAGRPRVSKAETELRKQVAPTGRASAPAATDNSKRVFTQQEIGDFYDRLRRHEFTAEQAAALEGQIDQAVAEGRVR